MPGMDGGRPVILVSNDDGYQAAGIRALAASMEPLSEVWVVAPEAEQSASSHAISIHRPRLLPRHSRRLRVHRRGLLRG